VQTEMNEDIVYTEQKNCLLTE